MTNNQKKLMMIKNIIESNEIYLKKYCLPLEEHMYEAILKLNYDLHQINEVLQGNFDI